MAGPTEEFFDTLARRGHERRLEQLTGSCRFELVEGTCTEHWYVEIAHGDITVSRENMEADAAFRTERALFDRIVVGEQNLLAALLRGAASIEGDLELILGIERTVPGPPASAARPRTAGAGSRS